MRIMSKQGKTEESTVVDRVVEDDFEIDASYYEELEDLGDLEDEPVKSAPKSGVVHSKEVVSIDYDADDPYGYSEELFDDEDPTPYGLDYRGVLDAYNKEEEDLSEESEEAKLIGKLVGDVVTHFTLTDPIALNSYERSVITQEVFMESVVSFIKGRKLGEETSLKVMEGFKRYMWSYGILDELIDHPDISDIKVLGSNRIRIKVNGKRETSELKFMSDQDFISFVSRVAIKNKVSISEQNALVNFTDKTSNENFILRFNISTKFVNSVETPYLHIRKIAKFKVTLEELIRRKMMSKPLARYLRRQAAVSPGMLFTGKGASGKTTAMNALLDLIPVNKSVSVMQENEELFSKLHPDMEFKHVVQNRGEGMVEYTLQDLARNGLLTDLDYFVIGEIKGGEALYLLNAVYTGAVGWASVHGASSTEAMKKLADYIKYASDYSAEDAMKMLVYMKTIVFLKDYKVWEVSEIIGWDAVKNEIIYKPVVKDGKLVVEIDIQGNIVE